MDYSDYEVHETYPRNAHTGVIAVLKNGNKGPVVSFALPISPTTLTVLFSELGGACTVGIDEVDHYLTPPKPKQLPTHPGLWKDKDGGVWLCTTNGALKLLKTSSYWGCDGSYTDSSIQNYAPFTELEVREKV